MSETFFWMVCMQFKIRIDVITRTWTLQRSFYVSHFHRRQLPLGRTFGLLRHQMEFITDINCTVQNMPSVVTSVTTGWKSRFTILPLLAISSAVTFHILHIIHNIYLYITCMFLLWCEILNNYPLILYNNKYEIPKILIRPFNTFTSYFTE